MFKSVISRLVLSTSMLLGVLAVPVGATDSLVDELASLEVLSEHSVGYDRDSWGGWSRGLIDNDFCNTRCELLAQDRRADGTWLSSYDGFVSSDASDFEVDHLVSVNEAHRSGGWDWSSERKAAFYNDRTTAELRLVSSSSNRSKSNRGPSTVPKRAWLPDSGQDVVCSFVADWIHIKAAWDLAVDPDELAELRQLAAQCGWSVVSVDPDAGNLGELAPLFAARPLHRGHSMILRLYWAVLGRQPELAGADYWVNVYDAELLTTLQIAGYFATSVEFAATYGPSLSDEDFVAVAYRNVLGREPELEGFHYWVNQMDRGLSRGDMILYVSLAPEFVRAHPLPSDGFADSGPIG